MHVWDSLVFWLHLDWIAFFVYSRRFKAFNALEDVDTCCLWPRELLCAVVDGKRESLSVLFAHVGWLVFGEGVADGILVVIYGADEFAVVLSQT